MKTFDEQLRAAYEAGYSAADNEEAPAFETYRATVGDPA